MSVLTVLMNGCGNGGTPANPTEPVQGATTHVTLLLSSTGNDLPMAFRIALADLTLSSQSGKSVPIFSKQQIAEAVHLNGGTTPLLSVDLPQDTYTSAQFDDNQIDFTYLQVSPGTFDVVTNETVGDCCQSTPSVSLPSPIAISGNSMALRLDLQMSDSIIPTGNTLVPYRTAANFKLTALPLSADNTISEKDIFGQVLASSSTGYNLLTTDGATLAVATASNTTYAGTAGPAALTAGTFLSMDGALQPDGSLVATRVQVADPTTKNLVLGTVINLAPQASSFSFVAQQGIGADPALQQHPQGIAYSFNAATKFGISSRFQNTASLPFSAQFDATSMGEGQHVWMSIPAVTTQNPYSVATNLTLVSQTLDATITAVSTQNGLTVYNVTLAPEDDVAQANFAGSAGTAVVYTDANTQLLNGVLPAMGTIARFSGLLFNDKGTLRMDCDQVNPGVAE